MARPTTKPSGGEPAKEAPQPEALTDAAREALRALKDVNASTAEVEKWIDATYPDFKYNKNTLSSTVSNARKELRGDAPGGGRGRGAKQADELTSGDLRTAKVLAEEAGGVEKLLATVNQLEEAAARVGGISRLRQCLEELRDLRA